MMILTAQSAITTLSARRAWLENLPVTSLKGSEHERLFGWCCQALDELATVPSDTNVTYMVTSFRRSEATIATLIWALNKRKVIDANYCHDVGSSRRYGT